MNWHYINQLANVVHLILFNKIKEWNNSFSFLTEINFNCKNNLEYCIKQLGKFLIDFNLNCHKHFRFFSNFINHKEFKLNSINIKKYLNKYLLE